MLLNFLSRSPRKSSIASARAVDASVAEAVEGGTVVVVGGSGLVLRGCAVEVDIAGGWVEGRCGCGCGW